MLPTIKPSRKLIYLDHAATTPVDIRVKTAMEPFWSQHFGNPSSLYKEGSEASAALAKARATIAGLVGARSEEIVFTAGGTESVNLAILGVARAMRYAKRKGVVAEHLFFPSPNPDRDQPHLITTTLEHHSVLHAYEALEEEGFETTYVEVNDQGFVDVVAIKAAVRNETVLVSVMAANNEIGTIEPIAEIGKWLRAENERRAGRNIPRIYFHTDACQVAGVLDLDVNRLGVDLLSVNGSKMYGPKQTGFLYVRSGTPLRPLIFGGGQEGDARSGTENVPGVVGLAEAFRLAQKARPSENRRLRQLRDYFIRQIFKKISNVVLNGPEVMHQKNATIKNDMVRLPNNVNVTFSGVEGEALMLYLDAYHIAASTGSACTTSSLDPSHVLLALGRTEAEAKGAMRFSLGKTTTRKDIDYVMKVLPAIVAELRRIRK